MMRKIPELWWLKVRENFRFPPSMFRAACLPSAFGVGWLAITLRFVLLCFSEVTPVHAFGRRRKPLLNHLNWAPGPNFGNSLVNIGVILNFFSRKKTFDPQRLRPTILLLALCSGFCSIALVAQTAPPPAPGAQDVLAFVNQTLGWYRGSSAEQQIAIEAADLLAYNDNRQLGDRVVRQTFDYARAAAQALATQTNGASEAAAGDSEAARYRSLTTLAAKYDQQVKQSQDELSALEQKLASANGAQKRRLQSAVAEIRSELEMAQARRDVMRNMLEFVGGTQGSSSAGGLRAQVEELERAVPAATGKDTAGQQTTASAVTAPRRVEASGLLALITDLIALSRKTGALDDRLRETDALAQTAAALRSPLGARLRELTKQGDALANQSDSSDPAVLGDQKRQLDALTLQFKQGSELLLPLLKQRILLDLYKRNLSNWRSGVRSQYTAELKSLVLRLAVLAVVVALVLGISEIWRKAIFKYAREPRRRYQLLLFRRIAVWLVVLIIVAFAFATELGSLATFAGLITAGVAVALQNVILSVAGYFFLIGKYGVRVGDRVQISGVTGEVVDVGLVRLHLMELSTGATDQPTGRVVVFSNSVVFQPTGGFFKQIPGTNFVWHEIKLTLAPESNYRAVEERLSAAVDAVFAGYHEQMEGQRRHMEKTLAASVHALRPQSRLRLTQTGLEVIIRYPLELAQAAAIDDRVTRELLDAIEREPKLKLVGTGTPNLQEVAVEPAAAAASRS